MTAKELRRLMPENAHDVQAARQLVALGPDMLMPIVPDMLRRIKDHRSPVADLYCEFFANHDEHFAAPIGNFLARTTAPDLKNAIVEKILVHWPRAAISKLAGTLQMLVTHTDYFNTDLVLIGLLHKHELSDQKWLKDWLEFKRDRLNMLSEEAGQLASTMANTCNS